jgi:hypothetical protein
MKPATPRVLGRIPSLAPMVDAESRGESERLVAAERQEPPKKSKFGQIEAPELRGDEFSQEAAFAQEARRVADELVRLHGDGAIQSQEDASFYANLIHLFDANYTKRVAAESDAIPPGQRKPSKHQRDRDSEREGHALPSEEERK